MNKLPKSWCVVNDGSLRFKETVIKFLNKNFGEAYVGSNKGFYYGVTDYGHVISNGCAASCQKNLTLEEFVRLSGLEEKETYELTKDTILKMAKESKEVEKSLRKAFPHAFEKDIEFGWDNERAFDKTLGCTLIAIRHEEEYANTSFRLSSIYDWVIRKDRKGELCLIPAKKKD